MKVVQGWPEVGERVRDLRLAHGLNQGQLAEQLGVDRTAVVRIEAGERQVSALELGRLADILHVEVAHFVTQAPTAVTTYRTLIADEPDQVSRDRILLDVDLEGHARDAEWLREQGFLGVPPYLITPRPVSDNESAIKLARDVRKQAGMSSGPLGSLAEVGELFGLYILVVDRDASGASLQFDPGFGVAVIGGRAQPGRRRWTAVHELGHHIVGDAYNSDVGVAASDAEKEKLIDSFVGEFLLPAEDILAAWSGRPSEEPFRLLVRLAAEYRLSWSSTVAAACKAGIIKRSDVQSFRARTPTRGDFFDIVGCEPNVDLAVGTTGPVWKRAVFAAWRTGRVSAERAVGLLRNTLSTGDLPRLDVADTE